MARQEAGARANLLKQAAKMIKTSNTKFPPLSVGDNVTVSVLRLDRATTDPRNILAVVLDVLDIGLYRVGNQDGILERAVA